jgi:hypothetical protein
MTRTILFRGKSKEKFLDYKSNKKRQVWAIGDLIQYDDNEIYILYNFDREWDILESGIRVIPETVSQLWIERDFEETCQTQIFENDIVQVDNQKFIVEFNEENNCLALRDLINSNRWIYLSNLSNRKEFIKKMIIIGNKFDNPELLGGV